jgi:hypothetical protein
MRTSLLRTLAPALLAAAFGCGGPTAEPAPAFTVSLSQPATACRPLTACGGTVSATPDAGFTGTITWTMEAPAGAAAAGITWELSGVAPQIYAVMLPLGITGGPWTFTVKGTSGATVRTATFTVSAAAIPPVLLVDDDASGNNDTATGGSSPDPADSASDALFRDLLAHAGPGGTAVPYDVWVVPTGNQAGPSFIRMAPYQTVVWYTGGSFAAAAGVPDGSTLTTADLVNLGQYSDYGHNKVLLFSQHLFWDYGTSDRLWSTPDAALPVGAVAFLQQDLGCLKGAADMSTLSYTVHGLNGTAAQGYALDQVAGAQVDTWTDLCWVNPGAPAQALFSVVPEFTPATGGANDTAPFFQGTVVVGSAGVGATGTSETALVTFPLENVQDGSTPASTKQGLFDVLFNY